MLSATLLLSSCKKDTQAVGALFAGARNQFNTQLDTTLELNAFSVQMDSVITSKLSAVALGSINDPYLGITQGSLVTQYGLPGSQFSWGSNITKLDSLVLQLRFRAGTLSDGTLLNDYYGDKDAVHTFKVYGLSEDLSLDSTYYSTRKYKSDGIEIGTYTGTCNFKDSVSFYLGQTKVILPPHIRIKMSNDFTTRIFNGEKDGYFKDDATFKAQFKGLVVVDESTYGPGQGAILYLKLNSDVSAITAYYGDSLAVDFPIIGGLRGSEAAYNYYEHKQVPDNLLQHLPALIAGDLANGSHRDTGYLQPLTGAKLRIELPAFTKVLANPKLVINGAEILFTPIPGTFDATYPLPASISLVGSDSLGRNIFLKDQLFESSTYYGGKLDNNRYKFNIVRHLQHLLIEQKSGRNVNYGMNLIVRADDPLTAQRVVLDTRRNAGVFKLKLTYTLTD